MKTPEERGPVGAWAYAARGDAGLSVEEVAGRLHDRGVAINPATLRGIEGGSKQPGRTLLRALSEIYGVHPPKLENGAPLGDTAALVAATDRQTAAIERQTEIMERLLAALVPVPQPDLTPEEREQYESLMRDVNARRRTTLPPRPSHSSPLE